MKKKVISFILCLVLLSTACVGLGGCKKEETFTVTFSLIGFDMDEVFPDYTFEEDNGLIKTFYKSTYKKGTLLEKPKIEPTNSNYVIDGWYIRGSGTDNEKKWNFLKDTVITDIEIYPKICKKYHTIKVARFCYRNGNIQSSNSQILGSYIVEHNSTIENVILNENLFFEYDDYLYEGLYYNNIPIAATYQITSDLTYIYLKYVYLE